MALRFLRRDFLKAVVVAVAAAPLPACGSDPEEDELTSDEMFPQGVASGDPTPNTVILWTRVAEAGAVTCEIALDEAFEQIVASQDVSASADADNTIRVKAVDLQPYTHYYYRFRTQGLTSRVGRTKSAPAPDQDVPVRFAFASCQDFVGHYYHSWKTLAEQEPDLDFVVFLGDYIYETNGDPQFQESGSRNVSIPDGIDRGSFKSAKTLKDYRGLYKQYRSDENLKRVHALYPFIVIWDDHEFANDCWQDHSTDFDEAQGDEKSPERREAASQAWFEFQPAEVPYDANASYPDDITIYRSFRYGMHVELFLTDLRYYRSDHVVPEGPTQAATGKTSENTSLGSRNFVAKTAFDSLEAAASPTMLGATQKAWLIDGVTSSTATWKLWATEVQLAQMTVDLSSFESLPPAFQAAFYFSADQWDGYRTERQEVLSQLAGVTNLVSIAGDIHAFYAAEIYEDFDNPTQPVAVEFTTAGISSTPVEVETEKTIGGSETLSSMGLLELIPRFDELLVSASPHYVYTKSMINGVAVAEVSAGEMRVSYLEIDAEVVKGTDFDGTFARTEMRTVAGSNRIEML